MCRATSYIADSFIKAGKPEVALKILGETPSEDEDNQARYEIRARAMIALRRFPEAVENLERQAALLEPDRECDFTNLFSDDLVTCRFEQAKVLLTMEQPQKAYEAIFNGFIFRRDDGSIAWCDNSGLMIFVYPRICRSSTFAFHSGTPLRLAVYMCRTATNRS
ncbi:MAG: hypothetical protein HQM09_00940 [Candidatus Riflebacteria bacterium]|nr:hypothetical protein [Candidatus Riflebacteria bacterium]